MRRKTQRRRAAVPAKIRHYRPADHDSCRRLWAELTTWHRRIYNDRRIGGSDPGRHFDVHLKEHGPKNVWVAEVDGEVVGMAGMIPGKEGPELEPLIVSEKCRGRGIGRQLSEIAIQAARRQGASMLVVRPVARNDTAIRFFHEAGFDTLGHIEMFIDLTPAARRGWISRETIAGKEFKC
jgi:GNAT superfamily N-acetyltransferase